MTDYCDIIYAYLYPDTQADLVKVCYENVSSLYSQYWHPKVSILIYIVHQCSIKNQQIGCKLEKSEHPFRILGRFSYVTPYSQIAISNCSNLCM